MARRKPLMLSKMPQAGCGACHGLGSVRMTAHFYTGDTEFEMPCWECFGTEGVARSLPHPRSTDNA